MISTGCSSTIDPKLGHLVRKRLSLSDAEIKPPNADQVVIWLRTEYREYKRKDVGNLTRQVQKVLQNIDEENKNKAIIEDNEYDKEARSHDEQRSNSSNGLNASLTNRYRKLQQSRDAETEASDCVNEINDKEMTGSNEGNGELPKKRTREDQSNNSSSNNNNNNNNNNIASIDNRSSKAAVGGGGKSTKRKKSSGNKRSSTGGTDPLKAGKDAAADICEAIPRPSERYTDLGGMEDVITQIRQLVEYPLIRPELYRHLGVDPPRGVLLRGPPG
jgi:ATP-dependent 26S proteasome regulatory subunit